eukprot:270239-Pyramimonas_sp.AAC.1
MGALKVANLLQRFEAVGAGVSRLANALGFQLGISHNLWGGFVGTRVLCRRRQLQSCYLPQPLGEVCLGLLCISAVNARGMALAAHSSRPSAVVASGIAFFQLVASTVIYHWRAFSWQVIVVGVARVSRCSSQLYGVVQDD